MTFNHPDKKLQRISRYYINMYEKPQKNYAHSLWVLSQTPVSYFCVENPFSFDDERYTVYPNKGWIDEDYDRILGLDLSNAQDLAEFRLIGANFARVILEYPDKIKEMKDYPHFDSVLEFILIEGLYDYFSIDIEQLLLVCVKNKLVKAGDCGAITMSKTLIFKNWLESLTPKEKRKFELDQKIFKLNLKFFA